MSEKSTTEILAYIGQNLKHIKLLEGHGAYYEITARYLDKLTTDEFEAALELATMIKQQAIEQPTSMPSEVAISSAPDGLASRIETGKSNTPKASRVIIKERATVLQEDRDKIDCLRQIGYTPVEISRLVEAKSDHWAKNIIYAHSATSPVAELTRLRNLDLEHLPHPPANAKKVQQSLQSTTSTYATEDSTSRQQPETDGESEESD